MSCLESSVTMGQHTFRGDIVSGSIIDLFVPGWATDYRVFGLEKATSSQSGLMVDRVFPETFVEDCQALLARFDLSFGRVTGLSLGGFLAVALAQVVPVETLVLVGVRPSYDLVGLDEVRRQLGVNKQAFLKSFYRQCFSDTASWRLFRSTLLKDYVALFSLESLLSGLDALGELTITASQLVGQKVVFCHGDQDQVAPLALVKPLMDEVVGSECHVWEGKGHLCGVSLGVGAFSI